MFNLTNIKALVAEGKLSEALDLLTAYLESGKSSADDDDAWFLHGRINWQLDNRREAMNDYRKAMAINPASPAATALEQAYRIMSFFNPDIFNP